ncbi:MAG: arginine deiminase family protein [Chitinophagaceae bacterium]
MSKIKVTTEIAKLKKLFVHSPGGEMNNMLPNKREEWLIDDILDTRIVQQEYQQYAKVLLLFLDSEKILTNKSINPSDANFHKSEKVIDTQYKLAQLFADKSNDKKTIALIEQVTALEKLYFRRKVDLIKLYEQAKKEFVVDKEIASSKFMALVKTLITGKLQWKWSNTKQLLEPLPADKATYIFKPIPNFIFTRDIGVSVNEHFLITKTANEVRHREVVLMKYIAECFLFKPASNEDEYKLILEKVIEVSEDDDYFQYDGKEIENMKVNFEGGDIMMVSPRHLLIGKSQRTSIYAINKLIHKFFKKNIGIEIISVIQIGEKRSQMHIDTIMTQVKEDVWMMYGRLSKKIMDEEIQKENMPYSHFSIIEQKGDLSNTSTVNDFVSIQQFYCKSGTYNESKRGERDFYIYLKDELEAIYADVIKAKKKTKLTDEELKRRKEFQSKITYEMLPKNIQYNKPKDLESLLSDISKLEFGVNGKVEFVYSGNKQYPYDEREQWTDGCNLLCLGNGVVIGYDRNVRTIAEFNNVMTIKNGKKIANSNKKLFDFAKSINQDEAMLYSVSSNMLLQFIKANCKTVKQIEAFTNGLKDVLITIPSSELSRARGGTHCMSLPLEREVGNLLTSK